MDETAAPAPAPTVALTIGQRLRAGRERAGLSVAASAEKLHLDPKVIESLESDRFGELGASVYVRGHLKRYGDFVGESGNELVAAWTAQRESPRPPVQDLTQIPHAERRSDPKRLVTPLVGLGSAVVLAAAIWWVLSGSKQPHRPRGETVQPTLSAEQALAATAPAPAATTVADTPAPVPAATTETPAGTDTTAAPKPDATTVRPLLLRFELAADSWVEVTDSRGERLFSDVARAGSRTIEGRPPLRVWLGNTAGVVVEVDGQVREIPDSARDGEGARFVVNRSGSLSRAR